MSLITLPQNIASGDADNPTRDMANWTTIRDIINGNLDNTNISASAAIAISKTTLGTFTDWTAWVPVWTGGTIGNAIVVANYTQIGNVVHFYIFINPGSTTTITGGATILRLSMPIAIKSGYSNAIGVARYTRTGVHDKILPWFLESESGTTKIFLMDFTSAQSWTPTPTDGDGIRITGTYPV